MPFIIGCTNYAPRICGRLLQEVMEEVENTLLIVERILCVTILCHNILLVFGLVISDIRMLASDCGIWISSTSYSGFDLSLVQLIA